MTLSIIIPVYNEADFIGQDIETIYRISFPDIISQIEIIIVDDASHDDSLKIVQSIAEKRKEITIIKHEFNRGKGSAVQTGLENARGDMFIVQDADLELSPDEIPRMIDILVSKELEMVNGSRFIDDFLHAENTFLRNFANKLFSVFASVLSSTKITDLTCGYKLFTRNLLQHINLKEKGFGIESELLIKAIKFNKLKVMEVPVKYSPREISSGKKIRFSDGFRILWTIVKYSLR